MSKKHARRGPFHAGFGRPVARVPWAFQPGQASDIQAGQHCSGYDGFYSFPESFHSP